ncbi:PLP-dependent aminotransferase family protein [Dasania marina]|uniref:MocR-like pyridoxine biosynthesis transcription factor PdxR n=1 Tax=Dasania marina TaxID=471499 RepID=UPI00036AB244|nr:PLP-dependent aminotransferase family protein [Dasania marina]
MNTLTSTMLNDIQLDKQLSSSLSLQLYEAIRGRVLSRQLVAGTKLASSRVLAQQLQISRNTVLTAIDQLRAEGYLESRTGSGVWVTSSLPDYHMEPAPALSLTKTSAIKTTLSEFGCQLAKMDADNEPVNHSFSLGVPALDHFPTDVWQRLSNRQQELKDPDLLGFTDSLGYLPLRESIRHYLQESRGINCTTEQILISYGAQQALDLCARVLLNRKDMAVVEEPGYHGMKAALTSVGASIKPCKVDQQGLNINALRLLKNKPKMIYTTPAHQYPLGQIMPLTRRLQLLEWAATNNCWIIEDDYDSEYHFTHRPLPAMQSLAQHDQVIYLGSFSKVLFPAIRLGYLVLPKNLIKAFTNAKFVSCAETAIHNQIVTANFLQEGHFKTHLKRMRVLYGERWQIIRRECEQQLPNWCELQAEHAGMHVVIIFNKHVDDQKLQDILAKKQLITHSLSDFYYGNNKRYGLVLGFANSSPEQIKQGIATIATELLNNSHNTAP